MEIEPQILSQMLIYVAWVEAKSFTALLPFFPDIKEQWGKLLLGLQKKGISTRTCSSQPEQLPKIESVLKTKICQMARNQALTNVNKIDF